MHDQRPLASVTSAESARDARASSTLARLSVILPCRNEADNIVPLLDRLLPVLRGEVRTEYEVIFVDDGSTD